MQKIEIDTESLPESIRSLVEEGKFDQLKTQQDIDNVLKQKQHVNNELSQTKESYQKEIEKYQKLLKDSDNVQSNPIYLKLQSDFDSSKKEVSELKKTIKEFQNKENDNILRNKLLENKDLLPEQIEDVLNRQKSYGLAKQQDGNFLNSEGKGINDFVESIKGQTYLFKRSVGAKAFNFNDVKQDFVNNKVSIVDLLNSLPVQEKR